MEKQVCVWKHQYCYTSLCPKKLGQGENIDCNLETYQK